MLLERYDVAYRRKEEAEERWFRALDQHSCRFLVIAPNGESAYSPGIGREASSCPTSCHAKKLYIQGQRICLV